MLEKLSKSCSEYLISNNIHYSYWKSCFTTQELIEIGYKIEDVILISLVVILTILILSGISFLIFKKLEIKNYRLKNWFTGVIISSMVFIFSSVILFIILLNMLTYSIPRNDYEAARKGTIRAYFETKKNYCNDKRIINNDKIFRNICI